MRLDLLPLVLFPGAALLAALVVWRLKPRRRAVALFGWLLTLASAALALFELRVRGSGADIRIDLLLTLPAIALAALAFGLAARRAGGLPSWLLAALGGLSLALFLVAHFGAVRQMTRLKATAASGASLYWAETLRCQGNLERRFGTFARGDHPCRGHFLAEARLGGLRATRLIVNDDDDVFLFVSRESGLEVPWGLGDDVPLGRIAAGGGPVLSMPCADPTRCREIELGAGPGLGCQAVLRSGARPDVPLALRPASPLAPCVAAAGGPVRALGPFAAVFAGPGEKPLKQLLQLWLWDVGDGEARALVLSAEGYPSDHPQQGFVRAFTGRASRAGIWELEAADGLSRGKPRHLRVELLGAAGAAGTGARLSGDAVFFRYGDHPSLPPGEVVSNARIALAPVDDAARFRSYFDDVFPLLRIRWTVP